MADAVRPKAWRPQISPFAIAVTAALLVAAGWAQMLMNEQTNPGQNPPEFGWPFAYRVEHSAMTSDGYPLITDTEYRPGALAVDVALALATTATAFALVDLIALGALGRRPFTTASLMLVVAVLAGVLAAGRLIPDQAGTLALWPFLFGLASPLLLLGLGYARALARNRDA
ncbi:hypothetical protein [Paludisphaera rhizosphaerae]|uniref:hypothetical protein n=1 Tax=Paludisphaera rhizosphaerae TaxID=2711216 RepID=UPI0013ED4069|nr:hypothetical protein [Paludisphaera rhizosphaerae]